MTILHFDGITRQFGRQKVLDAIQFTMDAGERVALRGSNGSGKTTLLRLAAGTLPTTQGTIHRNLQDLRFLAQDAPVYRELSVVDHLRFTAKVHREPWDERAAITTLRNAGLARMADRPAGTLSRGQRQRLGIALALQGSPDLLVLDEPWTALDADGTAWLTQQLDASDAAQLIAIHGDTPWTAQRTLTLDGGRLQ